MACLHGAVAFDATDPDQARRVLEGCLAALLDPMLWLWAALLTLLCSGIGALIGWWKGRTIYGLVWATVLGPIGWIVIALARSERHACARCGGANREFTATCRHCGAPLRPPAAEPPPRGG